MVYLDYHASHPILPEVQQKLIKVLDWVGNPSSVHQYGQRIRHGIEDVREQLAAWVGLPDARVIFTSGATEANNLVIAGHPGMVLASAIEHPAVLGRIPAANILAVTLEGILDLAALHERLETLPKAVNPLVSVMYANNETGVIQPIAAIARLVHQHGGLLHVDAVQALGRVSLDMRMLGIDVLSIAGHKIGAPPGVGALIAPQALPLQVHIAGGGQERGLRGGTENWLGIIGFGAAMQWFGDHQADYATHLEGLDAYFTAGLAGVRAEIVAAKAERLPGCALLVAAGADAQSLLMQLDLAGIAVSSGSACSSGTVADSHVLRAMGMAAELRASALRVSFGHATTEADLGRFLEVYQRALS
ncbi:MAG: cysteine desulfurase [Alphaproteobacteria bacterium]|nr:cysteine desulfurase [Alphaproteobacteria bacterium]